MSPGAWCGARRDPAMVSGVRGQSSSLPPGTAGAVPSPRRRNGATCATQSAGPARIVTRTWSGRLVGEWMAGWPPSAERRLTSARDGREKGPASQGAVASSQDTPRPAGRTLVAGVRRGGADAHAVQRSRSPEAPAPARWPRSVNARSTGSSRRPRSASSSRTWRCGPRPARERATVIVLGGFGL